MLRKMILLLAVMFFMALILFTGMMFMTNETEIYAKDGATLSIKKPAFFTLTDAVISEKGIDVAHKRELTFFGLPLGSYTLTERSLDNGVKVIFEHIENTSWMPFVLALQTDGLSDSKVNSWNASAARAEDDPEFGTDPTSNPYGTIALAEGEILQGNIYIARNLTLGNGEDVFELRHEISEFAIEENRLEKSFWISPKYQADTWFMLSTESLFQNKSEENAWAEHASINRREQLNWLTPQGPIVKIKLTEDLRTELAYDLIDDAGADSISAVWNEQPAALFFESMMRNIEIDRSN